MFKAFVEWVVKFVYLLVIGKLKSRAKDMAWILAGAAVLCFLAFAYTVWWPLLLVAVVLAGVWGLILITLATLESRGKIN